MIDQSNIMNGGQIFHLKWLAVRNSVLKRVNWIDATAISAYLRNAIATFNFGKTPPQLCVCLIDAITAT
jgi:hypothetical protein